MKICVIGTGTMAKGIVIDEKQVLGEGRVKIDDFNHWGRP